MLLVVFGQKLLILIKFVYVQGNSAASTVVQVGQFFLERLMNILQFSCIASIENESINYSVVWHCE